jgi:lipoprotein
MKTTLFTCAVAIAALSLTSCGSSKQPAAGAGDYQYQQFLAQQQKAAVETGRPAAPVSAEPVEAQQYAQRPKRTLREEDATVLLALEKSDHLRSYGDAVGFVESAVMDQAIMVAQERMSVLLKSALESAASNYTRNGNINLDNTSATLYESVTSRFSVNVSKDSRIIKRSVYDLDNGQVQIYVCIETGLSDNNLSKKLANELSRDGFLGLQFDRDRFAKQNEQSLKEYREKLNQTAEEGE